MEKFIAMLYNISFVLLNLDPEFREFFTIAFLLVLAIFVYLAGKVIKFVVGLAKGSVLRFRGSP